MKIHIKVRNNQLGCAWVDGQQVELEELNLEWIMDPSPAPMKIKTVTVEELAQDDIIRSLREYFLEIYSAANKVQDWHGTRLGTVLEQAMDFIDEHIPPQGA